MLWSAFSHLDPVVVEEVAVAEHLVTVTASTGTRQARCPSCSCWSERVHGRYQRRLADAAVAGRRAVVDLVVRRFICQSADCLRKTFVEQVAGLTQRYARRTTPLRGIFERIALALAGRPGSRLAHALAIPIGANTLLRIVRSLPEESDVPTPRVLGVDDFALKRGHIYATILIDMETGRRVDVLPDRTVGTFAAWLRAHPGVEIVCRDRSSAYAEAVRTAAPSAVQVADRFHMWKNLCEAVEKCVATHRACLDAPATGADTPAPASFPDLPVEAAPAELEGIRGAQRRERHAAVHELLAKGIGISAIGQALGMDRKTVRKYAHAETPQDMPVGQGRPGTRVQPYLAHLHRRWNEGCTDASRLCAEIRELGYRGSERTVRRNLQPIRSSGKAAPDVAGKLTVRQATNLITRHPASLGDDEKASRNAYDCLVQHSRREDPLGAQVERLGAQLLGQAEHLADALVIRIQAAVPVYRQEVAITTEQLHRTCLDNIHFVFGPIGRTPALTSPESRENGRLRARAGVPLAAVMEAYRVAARFLWDCLAESAARDGVPAEVTVRAASEMWIVLDTYTQQMAEGYREELTAQSLSREQERSASIRALLEDRLTETGRADTATLLGLPSHGSYVVIAAQVPGIGRHAVPDAQALLRTIDVASSWHLLHDVEVGIAHLPDPGRRTGAHQLDHLAELLGSRARGHAGISPRYQDLGGTSAALHLARIALLGAFDGRRVTVFDQDPLAVAAASAPEIMQRVARTVLGALDAIPAVQRALLLHTFGVWLDCGGSADQAAATLFCHPNTVRHRLRRLEEHTGRSLADPRGTAELALTFEIDRRLTDASTRRPVPPSTAQPGRSAEPATH